MDMNLLKYMAFIKTAECGSFTRAAELLNYSQSGISRMIHDLEEEWQVELLERSRAGVQLTSDGMQLFPSAKRLCAEYENLQTQVDELHGVEKGILRVGTFSSVASQWLPKIIRHFQRDYPHIEYELLLGDYKEIEAWVSSGRVDCGFLRLPAADGLESIFLAEDKLLAVLPEDHPLSKEKIVPIAALQDEPFMLLEKDGQSEAAAVLQENQVQPSIQFKTWDDYAIMSMVENGLGISILPQLILQRVPYRIVTRELDVPAYRRIGLVLRKERRRSAAVQRFLEYLPYR